MRILAREILAAADLYGEKEQETLAFEQAESTVRHWVFINILQVTPENYLVRKIASDAFPEYYTMSSIHSSLSILVLHHYKILNFTKLPESQRDDFQAMWHSFLIKDMSFLKFEKILVQSISLSKYDFASLCSGSRFLDGVGIKNYTAEDAIKTGAVMWGFAINEGVTEDKVCYFQSPALFF